jgi:hypothetical protein
MQVVWQRLLFVSKAVV